MLIDSSAVGASLDYLRVRSQANLKRLVLLPGNILAYRHHRWSSQARESIESFWRKNLAKIRWNKSFEDSIIAIRDYLETQSQGRWLDEVLHYLPRGHVLRGRVYLIISYDNIALDDDVALDLNSTNFHTDPREVVYYLVHELTHAGYYHYHPMPSLYKPKTMRELVSTVRYLTHLEGMGVHSSLRLRRSENGLLDNDYKTLMDDLERNRRVKAYFRLLSEIEENPDKRVRRDDFQIYNRMSRPRLWYVTGAFMAQTIQDRYGEEALRELVREGSEAFFDKYARRSLLP